MQTEPAYLDRVVDLVREVLDSARRRLLLRWVLRRGVRLCEVGNNDLNVALRSESAGLEQRLLVEDATLVHVQTGLYVVERVRDTINAREELVAVDA